jgi:hypothetical protein
MLFVGGVQLRGVEVNYSDVDLFIANFTAALLSGICQQLKERLSLVSSIFKQKMSLTVTTETKEEVLPWKLR